jgi:hypothetical protein
MEGDARKELQLETLPIARITCETADVRDARSLVAEIAGPFRDVAQSLLVLGSFARGNPAVGWSDLDLVGLTVSRTLPVDVEFSFSLGQEQPDMSGSLRWGYFDPSAPVTLFENRDKVVAAVLGLPHNSRQIWGSPLAIEIERARCVEFYQRAFARLVRLAAVDSVEGAELFSRRPDGRLKACLNLLRLQALLDEYDGRLDHDSLLAHVERTHGAFDTRAQFLRLVVRARRSSDRSCLPELSARADQLLTMLAQSQ